MSGRDSGSTLRKLFASFNPGTRSWRMSPRSGRGALTSSPRTWPRSGMTSGGRVFELPTKLSGSPTAATAGSGSQLPLFPTPKASDGPNGGPNMRNSKGQYDALPGFVVNVLPTPTARDWKSGAGAERLQGRNSRPLNEVVLLFKTPTANLGRNGAPQHPDKRKAGGHGPTLDDEVSFLLAESDSAEAQDWADFEPAIRRQEAVTGRVAPLPTELGPRGGRRLTSRFAEWLMGLPDGWVTAVPGLTRAQQLHKIGNGVAPAQAYEAYRRLLEL